MGLLDPDSPPAMQAWETVSCPLPSFPAKEQMGLECFPLHSLFLVICVLGSVLECDIGASLCGNDTGQPVRMDEHSERGQTKLAGLQLWC